MPTCLLGVAHINHLGIRSYENNNQLPCTCQPSPPKHRAANKEHCCTRVPPCDLESVVHGKTQPPCRLGEGCSTRRALDHAREQGSAQPTSLVLARGKGTTLMDVCCTFANPRTALQDAQWQNMEKHKLDCLLRIYKCVTVWAMGSSDPVNKKVMRSIYCRSHLSSSKSLLSPTTLPPTAIIRIAHYRKFISRTYVKLPLPGQTLCFAI